MEPLTDWYQLWQELSGLQSEAFARNNRGDRDDCWKHKARDFDKMVEERWTRPDSSRDFITTLLKNNPGTTLLDIGAGTGKWALLASAHAGRVTALEPSAAMQDILKEKMIALHADNIDIVTGNWPDVDIAPHDYVLASHSMYGVADFRAFVTKMTATATRMCIMVLRAVYSDAPMATASRKVLGQPYDSPNFQVAYNALMGMDIFPNVIMEDAGTWAPWTHNSFEEALDDIKNRLGLIDTPVYDDFLLDLLKKNLTSADDTYVWPVGNRSALIWWEV
jgi:SAM-dependent methyltransferase